MKVLHLPNNIASQITVTVRALRDGGIDAKGLYYGNAMHARSREKLLPRSLFRRFPSLLRAIAWADIVHWYFGFGIWGGLDLAVASLMKKKCIVEFWGSEVRIPEVECLDNPYFSRILDKYEYKAIENRRKSLALQLRFSKKVSHAFYSCRGILPSIRQDLFPRLDYLGQRLYLEDFPKDSGGRENRPLRIVHCPSAPIFKGTMYLESAIEKLKNKIPLEFSLVSNMPHEQAIRAIQQCDVYVDQLMIGTYGVAALEAMAFGKPVVCYIKDSLAPAFPPGLPILPTSPDNVETTLEKLLTNGTLRRDLGQKGQDYVRAHHDAHVVAEKLAQVYRRLFR